VYLLQLLVNLVLGEVLSSSGRHGATADAVLEIDRICLPAASDLNGLPLLILTMVAITPMARSIVRCDAMYVLMFI
jgi:hypothetical protein